MSLDYEMIVFSDDWHGLPFSCKHLLRHFLPEVPLTWVETIGLRGPSISAYDLKRSVGKLASWVTRQQDRAPDLPAGLRLLNPIQIPYNQFSAARYVNRLLIERALSRLRPRRQRASRVVLTTWPFLGHLFGRLEEDLSVYYRVDDFAEFPGVRRQVVQALERETMSKADLIVASAEELTRLGGEPTAARHLPHGVDYDHFAGAGRQARPGSVVGSFPSPRIGFFGLLSSWVDLDLIRRLAEGSPEWSFVLIGPSQLHGSKLPQAHNIHYVGPIAYDELPGHAAWFDVGLIPFKVNELTRSVNPLKLLEYFAMGIEVVSSPLPEVLPLRPHVQVAGDVDGFRAAIDRALHQRSEARSDALREIARSCGWEARSAELRGWIEAELRGASGATPRVESGTDGIDKGEARC